MSKRFGLLWGPYPVIAVLIASWLLAPPITSAQAIPVFEYQGSPLYVRDLIEDPVAGRFALQTGGVYGQPIILWEPGQKAAEARYILPEDGGGELLAFSPDGLLLAIQTREFGLRLYETEFGNLVSGNPDITARTAAFSPDGSLLLLGSAREDEMQHELALVSVPQLSVLRTTEECRQVHAVTWDPNDQFVLATSRTVICALDPITLNLLWKQMEVLSTFTALHVIPGRDAFLAVNFPSEAYVYDTRDGTLISAFDADDIRASSAYVHESGDLALLVGSRGLSIIDLNDMRYLERFAGNAYKSAFGNRELLEVTQGGRLLFSYKDPLTRFDFSSYLPAVEAAPAPGIPAPTTDQFLRITRDGTAEEIRLALRAGADPSAHDLYGQTPLMYAAGSNTPEAIQVLIGAGVNVDAVTAAGWTALMYAARDNTEPGAIRVLIDAGANPNRSNGEGQTAADLASTTAARVALAAPAAVTGAFADAPARNVRVSWNPNAIQAQVKVNGEPIEWQTVELPVGHDAHIEVLPEDPNYAPASVTYRVGTGREEGVVIQLERIAVPPAVTQQGSGETQARSTSSVPDTYASASGKPAPPRGGSIQATPEYVVNFLANELELLDLPCSPSTYSPITCGFSPDEQFMVELIVNSLFALYLQPAQRVYGWQIEPESGSYIAIFKRPEGLYAISYHEGGVVAGYMGR